MARISVQRLASQLKGFDWSLLKGSSLLSIGSAVARVLGLVFSLVLAAAFSAEAYGDVRYAIAVASIVSIGTMPVGQHVLARFVSKYRADANALDTILSNGFGILAFLFVVTLLVAAPVLIALGKFDIGILVIFLGETLFYAYWGLTSGFMLPGRLTAAYLGNNVIRILLVIILIQWVGWRSPSLALWIYGLSYLLPLALLTIYRPLPGHAHLRFLNVETIRELARFALPIWISHACYTLSLTIDLVLLERMGTESELGAYSLSKTFAGMFLIIPSGISTLLMPRVAATSQSGHRSLLNRMLLVSTLVNGIALLIYLPLAQPLTVRFFGSDYGVPVNVSFLLSAYMILQGMHSVITAIFVGSGRPHVETISRITQLLATATACAVLIPRDGIEGTALAVLIGVIFGLLAYIPFGTRKSHA